MFVSVIYCSPSIDKRAGIYQDRQSPHLKKRVSGLTCECNGVINSWTGCILFDLNLIVERLNREISTEAELQTVSDLPEKTDSLATARSEKIRAYLTNRLVGGK
jgi:hypothetical protein